MADFRFAHPYVFLLIIIALLFLLRWWRGRWAKTSGLLQYSDINLLADTSTSVRLRFRQLPNIIRLLAWLCILVALARPQLGETQNIIRGQGSDIVIALDISGSMAIQDFAPRNRLDASKFVLSQFIDEREFDRIGLVVFANDSFQVAPPTLNYDVLQDIVSNIQLATNIGIQDGSAIGLGIASATNMLRSSTAQSQIIILLTDGENNVGQIDAISAAEAASTLGIRLYTVGIGQRGVFAVELADRSVETITSNLDENTLQEIATIGRGEYFYAANLTNLQAIYDQIDRLERSPIDRQRITRWQDIGDSLMVLALILLVLERILRQTIFQTIP